RCDQRLAPRPLDRDRQRALSGRLRRFLVVARADRRTVAEEVVDPALRLSLSITTPSLLQRQKGGRFRYAYPRFVLRGDVAAGADYFFASAGVILMLR